MSGVTKKLMSASGGVAGFTAIEDVFSAYLYTGNGGTQTITNGIDLAGEGGLVWTKRRNSALSHELFDTLRGVNVQLSTNVTNGNITAATNRLNSFNVDGFTLGGDASGPNESGFTYCSWTFRKAPRFFDVVTYTGDGVAGLVINHNLNCDVGSIFIKKTSAASNWLVFHNNLGTSQDGNGFIKFNTAAADDRGFLFWGDGSTYIAPTSSTFTLSANADVNESGATYVAYLFAHDPLGPSGDGSDGLIDCGSYTGNGSATGPVVNLGWEPQWLLVKRSNSTGDWNLIDNMRGFTVGGADAELNPNLSAAESTGTFVSPTATGFQLNTTDAGYNASGGTYVYITIRRGPMRAPTSGTEVFAIDGENDTAPNPPTYNSGFPVDLSLMRRNVSGTESWYAYDRLRGSGPALQTNSTAAELTAGGSYNSFDSNTGLGTYTGTVYPNAFAWMFRRAPEFFDVVAYTGDGTTNRTVPHSLGVAPELVIVKNRDQLGYSWIVGAGGTVGWNNYLRLDSNTGKAFSDIYFGNTNTPPTDSGFYVGRSAGFDDTNRSPNLYIAYLFSTLAGISKVGSYTGNGTSQTINCGFTTGARFILIKRTDSTGDWYVWDTARGIVAANDPHLSLNTTAAEVTTNDSVDPVSSGFIVNQVAATNINVSAASYIFYAVA